MLKKRTLNKLGKPSLAEKVQKVSGDAANQEEAASTSKPTRLLENGTLAMLLLAVF